MSLVSWTDSIGAATLGNAFIYPGNRFANWNPANKPFGERSQNLGTGELNVTAFRDDLTVALDVQHIPNTDQDKMLRLEMHLKRGGAVTLTMSDPSIPVFGTCKLAPGADVQISPPDKVTLEHTFSTVLRGGGDSFMISPDGTTEFILWLQADKPAWPSAVLPADASALAQWNDTTGNGNHGVPPTALGHPRFDTNELNGLPGVYFDGNNYGDPSFQHCDRVRFPDDALVDLTEGEAFIVLKLDADPPTNDLFSGIWQFNRLPPPTSRSAYPWPGDGKCYVAFGGSAIDIGTPPFALDQPHIFNAAAGADETTFRFNAALQYTDAGAGWNGFPNLPAGSAFATLGGDSDAFTSLMGHVFEFIFYSPIRTVTQRAAIHSYLATKWGITI